MFSYFYNKIKCTSGATAIEYGLIASVISIAAVTSIWSTGQETSNNFNRIANTLENRQGLLDGFYDLTAESRCNGFGSCGNNGNQGIWEAFKDTALSNKSFDDLMTDRTSFEIGIFAEARTRTQEKMGMTGVDNRTWHTSNQTAVRQAAQEVWQEIAMERSITEAE